MTKARDLASNAEGTKPKVIDAAGDLIYGTGSDAASRLAIGTAGQVLAVNSGATAPEWKTPTSGGYTLITSGSSPAAATLALTSIAGTYRDLILVLRDFAPTVSNQRIDLRVNNNSTGIYAKTDASASGNATDTLIEIGNGNQIQSASANSSHIITFYDYANTDANKIIETRYIFNTGATTFAFGQSTGIARTTSAISEINLLTQNGNNFASGGAYALYGRQ